MLVNGTPSSWRRLAVDDDGFVVRTGGKKHAKLRVRPTDLPDRTGVPGERIELVVLGVTDNLEDIDLAVARCGGELLAIVVQLRVVDVAAVMSVYRLQGGGSHLSRRVGRREEELVASLFFRTTTREREERDARRRGSGKPTTYAPGLEYRQRGRTVLFDYRQCLGLSPHRRGTGAPALLTTNPLK